MSVIIPRSAAGSCLLVLALILWGSLLAGPALAGTRTVCPRGCAYSSIQAAVDAAVDGDTILIQKGRFVENVAISDKSLTLNGSGALLTVVDGGGTGRAFTVTGAFGVTRVSLSGMTITGGRTSDVGGGIACGTGELTVTDSVVIHNTTQGLGAGIYTTCAQTSLIRTLITLNNAAGAGLFDGGGGICAVSGVTLTLTDSIVAGNRATTDGGGLLGREVTIIATDSAIDRNRAGRFGGGIVIEAGRIVLGDSLVANNKAGQDGGGLYSLDSAVSLGGTTAIIRNQPDDCTGCP